MLSSEFQSIKIKKAAEAIAVKTMVVNNTAFFFFKFVYIWSSFNLSPLWCLHAPLQYGFYHTFNHLIASDVMKFYTIYPNWPQPRVTA